MPTDITSRGTPRKIFPKAKNPEEKGIAKYRWRVHTRRWAKTHRERYNVSIRAHYDRNIEKMRLRSRVKNHKGMENRRRKIAFNSGVLNAMKAASGCVDCGEKDPIVLDFDHRNPDLKRGNVSCLRGKGATLEVLLLEVAQCDVRCSNCHRRRTHRQRLEKLK